METATIEHLIGVITPVFRPETSFRFRVEEGRLVVEGSSFQWLSLLRPQDSPGVTVTFTREFLEAYEAADELARGAADGMVLTLARQHLAQGESSWTVESDDVGLPVASAGPQDDHEAGPVGSGPCRREGEEAHTDQYSMVRYWPILDAVEELEFIADEQTADAAVKAVMGTLTSRLPEDRARELAGALPEPLTFEKLRGHQVGRTDITSEQYVRGISEQFRVDQKAAKALICTTLSAALEGFDDVLMSHLEEGLPSDWRELLREC